MGFQDVCPVDYDGIGSSFAWSYFMLFFYYYFDSLDVLHIYNINLNFIVVFSQLFFYLLLMLRYIDFGIYMNKDAMQLLLIYY